MKIIQTLMKQIGGTLQVTLRDDGRGTAATPASAC